MIPPPPDEVLRFWFGALDGDGFADEAHQQRWFMKDAEFDAEIRDKFEIVYDAIVDGAREYWLVSAPGRLAYLIVLDQFSRNMYRDTPKMYAADEQAQRVALEGLRLGHDRDLVGSHRTFLYMPLMHSEDAKAQDRCVQAFEEFAQELDGDARTRIEEGLKYARHHRDIVATWGRFPHRNEILGRQSTPEELGFLKKPASSF